MKKLFLLIFSLLSAILQAQTTIYLINKGGNDIVAAEEVGSHGQIYNITEPRIDVYLPKLIQPTPMLLVCPGGAYEYVSVVNEGKCVADWAIENGIAVAVLKYRMPNGHDNIPLEDAMSAMKIIRDSAAVWNVLPNKIGVMGFSAGGHLAGSLLTMYADQYSRPDFGVLVYPVLSMNKDTHQKTRRLLLGDNNTSIQSNKWTIMNNITPNTPPCFVVACQDDKAVPVSNSLDFYSALTTNGVKAELLIMPTGGHGFGFQREIPQTDIFHQALLNWILNL